MVDKELRNGNRIPCVGLGTWQVRDRDVLEGLIRGAYDAGYRLIDTAAVYSNEIALAKAIEKAALPREELILSDKVWNTYRGYEKVREACKNSLKKLKTDYLDLYLIHWPASPKLYDDWEEINAETWRGMESLLEEGLVRAIGVSNFKIHHLEALRKTEKVKLMVNQVEFHPGMCDEEMVGYCREHGIVLQASSPLGNGEILSNEVLMDLAKKKERTVAQIVLRWEIQKGLVVIPKTVNRNRLAENMDIFRFGLDDKEMKLIDEIPFCGGLRIDSDEVTEFG